MKRLISILFVSFLLLSYACVQCPTYPTDKLMYLPDTYSGKSLTYCSFEMNDSISFLCGSIKIEGKHSVASDAKSCNTHASQRLTNNNDSYITYTNTANVFCSPCDGPWFFSIGVEMAAFGLRTTIHWDLPDSGLDIDHSDTPIFLPEWTAADGTRYENVYHLAPDAETALYLAPGLGIVQIETSDKIYYLRQ